MNNKDFFLPDWFEDWFERNFPKNNFSPIEVAYILKVNKSVIYRAIYTGELFAIKAGERRYIIPKEALKEFLKKRNIFNLEN